MMKTKIYCQMMITFTFFVQFIFLNCFLFSAIDLEEMTQNFVIETKKIEIPGFPHAFNPSIIRWKGALLLSFRDIPNSFFSFNSHLGLVWLDEKFTPVGEPQLLDTQDGYYMTPSRAEDARLIIVNDRLYIVYSDNKETFISKGGFRVYIAEIRHDGKNFSLHDVECLSRFEGESRSRREKNWVPFDYQGDLLLAYSLTPHLIFRNLFGKGECETFSLSSSTIDWEWGELRGGTPGIKFGDHYLSFFHSSKDMVTAHSDGKQISHYFMGAYTFSAEPPFEITKISQEPIVGKGFYNGVTYKPYWKPVRAIFPCGFVYDDKHIWVAYGRQDHEVWVVKLAKNGLYQSLVPVRSSNY